MKTGRRNWMPAVAGMTMLAICLGVALAAVPVEEAESQLTVEQGVQKLVHEDAGVSRVAVGDPAVADVNVVGSRDLLITGKTLGITSLMVWPSGHANPKQYRVRVVGASDPARMQSMDPEMGKSEIEPGQRLDGRLPNLLAHRRAHVTAQNGKDLVDRSTVDMEAQVLTQIRIAEVSRSTLQQYGFNLFKSVGNTVAGIGTPGSLNGVTYPDFPYSQPTFSTLSNSAGSQVGAARNPAAGESTGVYGLQGNLIPLQNAFNLVFGNPINGFLGVLSILEQKGLARTLAEPSLTAMSGQTASFLAGGEFPVPVSQGGANVGSVTIQYKEFGVRLSLTPTVLARDRIALKVAPEVSDLNFSAGIQVAGVAVPALNVRRTDTTIELGDGETFVISGLVSNNLLSNVDKVPWLGDIPIIGALFRSSRINREDKELIMVVTPHLVRPLAKGAAQPPLPGSRYDEYRPGAASFIFLENGNYNSTPSGYSR
jgi:pilus assembly protein CpaC